MFTVLFDRYCIIVELPGDPKIIQNGTAYEGEVYTVECCVHGGKPLPTFSWSFIGKYAPTDLIFLSMQYNFGVLLLGRRLYFLVDMHTPVL